MKSNSSQRGFSAIIVAVILGIVIIAGGGIFVWQYWFGNNAPDYVFDKSKFCPDDGDCENYGLESRICDNENKCVSSCNYGCVSEKWIRGRMDCEAMWPNFKCGCIKGICQRTLLSKEDEALKPIMVRQAGGQALLIGECEDRNYINNTADYIIEGTVDKVESKEEKIGEGKSIFTYTDLTIEKYVKGTPFESNKLQIKTDGGTVGEIAQWTEDQPIFQQGKKVRIYFKKETNGEFWIICGGFGVENIGAETFESIQNETANWKIYKNEKYGFEVKYPQKWNMEEYTKTWILENDVPVPGIGISEFEFTNLNKRIEVNFCDGPCREKYPVEWIFDGFSISVYEGKEEVQDIEKWFLLEVVGHDEDFLSEPDFKHSVYREEHITSAGRMLEVALHPGAFQSSGPKDFYFIKKSGKIYEIKNSLIVKVVDEETGEVKINEFGEEEGVENAILFNTILSTFKFIE